MNCAHALSLAPKWFSLQTETFVEILAGYPHNPDNFSADELASLIYGRVDDMRYDPAKQSIELTGRDLTAALIDTKISENFPNKTASQIVTSLAKRHGFTTGLITRTHAPAGTFYENDYVLMVADRSEWDVICSLAKQEKFVCFLSNHDLYFGPDPLPDSNPYLIEWTPPTDQQAHPTANVVALEFSRSQTISKGIVVTVRSANMRSKKGATIVSYPSIPHAIQPGKASPFGAVQPYTYDAKPGLTPQQCLQLAQAYYRVIIQHEMKLHARLPGDNLRSPRRVLQVTGTDTAYDQIYFPLSGPSKGEFYRGRCGGRQPRRGAHIWPRVSCNLLQSIKRRRAPYREPGA